jgi:hypothetical protein
MHGPQYIQFHTHINQVTIIGLYILIYDFFDSKQEYSGPNDCRHPQI